MRSINEKFTDEEFKRLEKAKGGKTWHNFIMTLGDDTKNENRKD